MKLITTVLAVCLLAVGFLAMSDGYSHPGSLAKANETQNIYGAECYMPSAQDVWICSGGVPPSNCAGCGCQLWTFSTIIGCGGGSLKKKLCDADPLCEFDDVDVSRFCNGSSKSHGPPPPTEPGGPSAPL